MPSFNVPVLVVRLCQFVFTIIAFSISASLETQAWPDETSQINFALVATIFALLALIYFAIAFPVPVLGHPWIVFGWDLLATILLFCSAIALSAQLGVNSCTNQGYLNKNPITRGSENRCRLAQVDSAFIWFAWASWVAGCVISGMGMSGSGVGRSTSRV